MAAASGTGRGQVRCEYHPDAHLAEDYRAGDMICTECGLVVGDRVIDVGRFLFPALCINSKLFSVSGELSLMTKTQRTDPVLVMSKIVSSPVVTCPP